MEQIDFSQIPYSQHHREAAMMLGDATVHSVFTYLLDEYLYRVRAGKPGTFKISCSKLGEAQGVYRKKVKATLQQLETMRLIKVDGNNVSVNGNVYASLIYAFHNLVSLDQKHKFSEHLQVGAFEPLEEMGYVDIGANAPTLLGMTGGVFNFGANAPTSQQIGLNEPTLLVQTDQNDKVGLNRPKSEKWSKQTNQVGANRPISQIIGAFRPTSNEEQDLIGLFAPYLNIDPDSEAAKELNLVFLGQKNDISEETELVCLHQLVSQMLVYLHQRVGLNAPTEINNKYIKRNNQQAGEFSENFEPFETDDSFDELPDNLPKIRKGGKHFQKVEYPYFPASEVLSFIQDIHQCLDDDVKLFLYNFNQELHARYDQDAEYDDETGELIKQQSTVDTSQLILPKSEVEDIASTAISNTRADIADRNIYVNDEQVEITAIDNLDRLTKFNIMDWDFKLVGDGEKVCQIDWSKIQNPNAEPIGNLQQSSKRSRRTKDGEVNTERELNKQYIASIIEHSAEDETWEKLSPMEKLIYNFLCDHFEFSEDGLEVVDVKEEKKYLNRNMLFQYFQKELDSRPDTPSQEDFFSTFAKDKPDTYGGIKLRPNMFSAAKIQHWNSKHGFQSVFSASSIQVTTEEEKTSQNV